MIPTDVVDKDGHRRPSVERRVGPFVIVVDKTYAIHDDDPRLAIAVRLTGLAVEQMLHELVGERSDPTAEFVGAPDPAPA